eukprot:Gb_17805 [translate_table: standard]
MLTSSKSSYSTGMELLFAASWLLEHLPILLRVAWLVGIGSILLASIPVRPLGSWHSLIMGIAKRGKHMHSSASTPRFSVPQSYFLHFYLVGVTCTTVLLVASSFFAYCTTVPPASESMRYSSVASHLTGGADSLSFAKPLSTVLKHTQQAWKTVFMLLLMEAQVVRRLYETVYVFNYSPSARMHILGYLSGLLWQLPIALRLPRTSVEPSQAPLSCTLWNTKQSILVDGALLIQLGLSLNSNAFHIPSSRIRHHLLSEDRGILQLNT